MDYTTLLNHKKVSEIVHSLALRTVANPELIKRVVQHWILQTQKPAFARITKSDAEAALQRLQAVPVQNKKLQEAVGILSKTRATSEEIFRAEQLISVGTSEMDHKISFIGTGLAHIEPAPETIQDLCTVLLSRLPTAIAQMENGSQQTALTSSILNGSCTIFNSHDVAHELFTELVQASNPKAPVPQDSDTETYVPTLVAQIAELEHGISGFDIIVVDKTKTARQAKETQSSVVFWRQAFMAIPQAIIFNCELLGPEFFNIQTLQSILWNNHAGFANAGGSGFSLSATGFKYTDIFQMWYHKDLWELFYLQAVAQLCAGAPTFEALCEYRRWFAEICTLVAIARGKRTQLDFSIVIPLKKYNPAKIKLPQHEMRDKTVEEFLQLVESSAILPFSLQLNTTIKSLSPQQQEQYRSEMTKILIYENSLFEPIKAGWDKIGSAIGELIESTVYRNITLPFSQMLTPQ